MAAIYDVPGKGQSGLFGFGGRVGADTFAGLGGAASDLFKGFGAGVEAKNYDAAAVMSDKNEQYTKMATAVKEAQQTRALTLGLGETRADVAGAGFSEGGSALDLLRDSASQGALAKETLNQQGLITEEGYQQQAASYRAMADSARTAQTGDFISGIVKGAASIATLV